MNKLRLVLLVLVVAAFTLPLSTTANAQIAVGVGIGDDVGVPPVCDWGYYSYYPYACAPYGYYGPSWFADGLFIGAGPWYGYGCGGGGCRFPARRCGADR